MKKTLALAAALLGLALITNPGKAHAGPYGDAGCGLGSMLFGAQPGLVQVLAGTTNGTFYSQTFGITTGTSNCGQSGGPGMAARNFVETNREAFAKDAARGSGETIATLATIAGCSDGAAVGKVLQSDFDQIFTSAQASDRSVSANVIEVLKSKPTLSCAKI
jgi:hypothetical protein